MTEGSIAVVGAGALALLCGLCTVHHLPELMATHPAPRAVAPPTHATLFASMENGKLTLTGTVPPAVHDQVMDWARQTLDRELISDRMEVSNAVGKPPWLSAAPAMLALAVRDLPDGEVALEGFSARLTGEVADGRAHDRVLDAATAALRNIPITDEVLVAPRKEDKAAAASGRPAGKPVAPADRAARAQRLLDNAISGRTVEFAPGSADLGRDGRLVVDRIIPLLGTEPQLHLRVEGHTDGRGNPAANTALSQRRAEAVVQYLVSQGVDRERLSAEGFGSSRPLVNNNDEAGARANRRIEFHLQEGR